MLLFYKILTYLSGPFLYGLLQWRVAKGKEDKARLPERMGRTALKRPDATLIWIHAASVGEAQSALILIERLSTQHPAAHFLVTSGTQTSASLMAQRLPPNAVHQYVPLDHPCWVGRFITHWHPDLVLWMESELWPNMLGQIKRREIPAILINARLSNRSFKRWSSFKATAQTMLSTFSAILTQTTEDQNRFIALGAKEIHVTDNLKYSASPLPVDPDDLTALRSTLQNRPTWVYASTHDGEETLAARIHADLKINHPTLLTIIVPRHPARRDSIQQMLGTMGLNVTMRGEHKALPTPDTDIYVADTLGELGLFYASSPLAMIGRSFSHDGGGGHNPIEAAQLSCAVLTGPNIQYQTQLFDDMRAHNALTQVMSEDALLAQLKIYLANKDALKRAVDEAQNFAKAKENIVDKVIEYIMPYLPNPDKGL